MLPAGLRSTFAVRLVVRLIVLLCLSGAVVFANGHSASAPVLSPEELAYLKSRGPIIFVSQSSYPPFEFHQKDGSMDGICSELARWISTEMGIQARFVSKL